MPPDIVIEPTMKQALKTERLTRYKGMLFNLQMDIEAYKAIGDTARQANAEKQLADYVTSYRAVEAIPVE